MYGALLMVVVVPPMIFGPAVVAVVLALRDDFLVVWPAMSSPASAPTMRFFSVASDGWLTTGFAVGVGSAVAAPADVVSTAAVTAAAMPAAATGRAKRIRRLCRPAPGMDVPTEVPPRDRKFGRMSNASPKSAIVQRLTDNAEGRPLTAGAALFPNA